MSDTAIEALKYSEFPNSSDCISRQAAIDAMRRAKDKSELHRMLVQLPSAQPTGTNTVQVEDCISRQAVLDALNGIEISRYASWYEFYQKAITAVGTLPSAQPGQRNARVFQGIIVEYPSISAYPEYEGKPYFSIKYTENGQEFIGYGTYKPEVLSEYLKEYFMPPTQPGWIPTSQKPPEPFKLVLIQDSCGGYDLSMYIPSRIKPKQYPNGYWGDVDCVDYDYLDVYAWYPLPKEYRPEGEEQ